ncbi:MAG TPA: SDR family oxidoreductase [Nitrososphaerales archaeon]|nr:SDR family oxidoreductase [Nitrososphaerales archaeon]
MENKLSLVTGASSGIGRATAARLAGTGLGVVMVSRDRARGESAKNEIISQTKNSSVDLMVADLSSLASVRSLAAEFGARYSRLDILVNNAATFLSNRVMTPDGFELMFETNYLGPFLLTRLLVPYLEAGERSRIINVTAPSTTRPNLDDLQGERKFSALGAFGASKAANLLFTYALARRLEGRGVTVNAYHPGIVRTNLNRSAPAPVRFISSVINAFAGKTPEKASEGLVQLATSPEFSEKSGTFVHDGHVISAPFIEDQELQDHPWNTSCGLVGTPESI